MEPIDKRSNQFFRNVVERRPQEHDIKLTPFEIKVLLKKAVDIESGRAALFCWRRLPTAFQGFMNYISDPHAVSETGEMVDVRRRGRANIEHTQRLLRLEVFLQGRPAA